MKVIKRDGTNQEFNIQNVRTAIAKAFFSDDKNALAGAGGGV